MSKKNILFLFFLCFVYALTAQSRHDSIWQNKPIIHISGFVDIFYVYDFNQPQTGFRQAFLFNHNRHNEVNLNLGILKLGIEHGKYRTNLAIHTGTYANDNYAAEPGLLKNIFEANAGVSLDKKNKLWLDAGVFASHIGFESAVSIDNLTLTRSLPAENSPYFLTGAKLTYTPNSQLTISALLCNGWQRIQRLQESSFPSFGTQFTYRTSDKAVLNWSTFIGTDDPDTTRRIRCFNDFYGQFQFGNKFNLITGFDIGMQQQTQSSSAYKTWFSPVIIGQLAVGKNWKTALRAEYYQDKTGIIITASNGFKTSGFSLNLDYSPAPTVACRVEGRWLNSPGKVFETKNGFTTNNLIIGASIAIEFSEELNR